MTVIVKDVLIDKPTDAITNVTAITTVKKAGIPFFSIETKDKEHFLFDQEYNNLTVF